MEQMTEVGVNLFADQLPSMEELRTLSHAVHASEASQMKFAQQVEENKSKTSAHTALATGIGLFMLGRYNEAMEKLRKGQDSKEKYMYLAFALRRMRRYDEAIEFLQKALHHGAEAMNVSLEKAATYRQAGNLEAAGKEIQACANFENVSAEYHYQLARLQEARGEYSAALTNYQTALQLAPGHQRALFHLAYR